MKIWVAHKIRRITLGPQSNYRALRDQKRGLLPWQYSLHLWSVSLCAMAFSCSTIWVHLGIREYGCAPIPQIHVHPAPVNVTLIRKRTITDVIMVRWGHAGLGWAWIQWLMSSWEEGNLVTETHSEKTAMWQWRTRLEGCIYKLRNPKECLQPLEARKDKEGSFPWAFRVWPCQKPDFGLAASRTGEE